MSMLRTSVRALAVGAWALGWAAAAQAVSFEVDLHVGRTAPTFKQTLSYDASAAVPPVQGVSVHPLDALRLEARGGLAVSGAATLYFAGPLGLEARVDGLDADLETRSAAYDLRVERWPLPPFSARLELGGEGLALERVTPVSLNLRLTTPGPVRLSLSGGVSRLGAIKLRGTLGSSLRLSDGPPVVLPPVQVRLAASAPPGTAGRDRYGLNAGAALQVALGHGLALSVEGRGFIFKKRVLTWSGAGAPGNVIEEALQRELLARLEPLRFTPTFFAVNAGLALRF